MKDGVTLIRLGGHFPGGTVLHWQQGADGNEVLLSGDVMNTREEWVSMREAASRLKAEGFKISPNKVSRLASRNKIRTQEDPLDES